MFRVHRQALKKVQELLKEKKLDWIIYDINLKQLNRKDSIGKYSKNNKGKDKIYLSIDNDVEAMILALLHECGHYLYFNCLSDSDKKQIKKQYDTEHPSSLSISDMLEILKGRPLFDLGKLSTYDTICEGTWLLHLDSGGEIEVVDRDALEFLFYEYAPKTYSNKQWFPSAYSMKNQTEWFAELFAYGIQNKLSTRAMKFVNSFLENIQPKNMEILKEFAKIQYKTDT